MSKLIYLYHTLRFLTVQQMWFRGRRVVRKQLWRLVGRRAPTFQNWRLAAGRQPLYAGLKDLSTYDDHQFVTAAAQGEADLIEVGEFVFLNTAAPFDDHSWHNLELSHLWRYHLHYFGYVRPLLIRQAVDKQADSEQLFLKYARSWIDQNRYLRGDGWHPYTLSLRSVNWIHARMSFRELNAHSGADTVSDVWQDVIDSLFGQAQILAADLEHDVRGNHLLENLRALIWLGLFFEGPDADRWLETGLTLLKSETAEQILADGGHFERTPGYQLLILQDYLEIGLWLRRNLGDAPDWVEMAVRRQLDFVMRILPPDGRVPLIKDSSWDAAPDPYDLLAAGAIFLDDAHYKIQSTLPLYARLLFSRKEQVNWLLWPVRDLSRPPTASYMPESGFVVMKSTADEEYAIVDVGKPCPDYLPAHAHADLFSYELHWGGQRLIVDGGVYEYTAGPWRNYFRSTRAHNTIEVNGQNQSEVWSSFRVARRAQPYVERWGNFSGSYMISAWHDGYHRLSPKVSHQRTFIWKPGKFWLVVDELYGRGHIEACNFIHFVPEVGTPTAETNGLWCLNLPSSTLYVQTFGHAHGRTIHGQTEPHLQGWHASEFGQLEANAVLQLEVNGQMPLRCGYIVSSDQSLDITFDLRDVIISEPGSNKVVWTGQIPPYKSQRAS